LSSLRVLFEEFDNVTHGKHALSCFVRNLATKFILKAHGELDSVEAIGAEIVDEIIVFCYLIQIDAEMFGDDPLNPLANSTHRFPTFFLKVEAEAPFCALHEVDQAFNGRTTADFDELAPALAVGPPGRGRVNRWRSRAARPRCNAKSHLLVASHADKETGMGHFQLARAAASQTEHLLSGGRYICTSQDLHRWRSESLIKGGLSWSKDDLKASKGCCQSR
jgi:hypothetical protein